MIQCRAMRRARGSGPRLISSHCLLSNMSSNTSKLPGMGRTGKAVPSQQERRDVLLHFCITVLAAGALVAAGHWFSSRRGRCVGGDRRRLSNTKDEDKGLDDNKNSNCSRPMSLAELRLRRVKAAEARLCSARNNGPPAVTLTPLGRILKLADRGDKLEEETKSLLENVSAARVMDTFEEKEQARLLELLTELQIEVDGVPGDESVRPYRKHQTNRIQTLIASLDQLKHGEISAGIVHPEAGSTTKT